MHSIAGIEDLADITSYLHPPGTAAVFNLGLVQEVGVPTRRRLVEALRDPLVGQNVIASAIEWEMETGLSAHKLRVP